MDAKANLSIYGYPKNREEKDAIRREALRLFEESDDAGKRAMRQANWALEAYKVPMGSMSLSHWNDSSLTSSHRASLDSSVRSFTSDSNRSNTSFYSPQAPKGILKNRRG